MNKIDVRPLSQYPHQDTIQTRWMDNDVYGHVNNVVYYSYFDTLVNEYLINKGALDIHAGGTIGLVVETKCQYFAPIEFPQKILGGIGVSRIGNSSVRYEIGLFDADQSPVALGTFTHVYVDRETRKSKPLSDNFKAIVQEIEFE
jgi:acyl-CoA thioester hydrolase